MGGAAVSVGGKGASLAGWRVSPSSLAISGAINLRREERAVTGLGRQLRVARARGRVGLLRLRTAAGVLPRHALVLAALARRTPRRSLRSSPSTCGTCPAMAQSSKEPSMPSTSVCRVSCSQICSTYGDSTQPHVVAHDFGGAVSLRAHLLHGRRYRRSAWSTSWRCGRGARSSSAGRCQRRRLRGAAARRASRRGRGVHRWCQSRRPHRRRDDDADRALVVEPRARQRSTGRSRRRTSVSPTRSSRGTARSTCRCTWSGATEDTWIPVDRARELHRLIPGSTLELIEGAGHLIQLDAPVELWHVALHRWLTRESVDG